MNDLSLPFGALVSGATVADDGVHPAFRQAVLVSDPTAVAGVSAVKAPSVAASLSDGALVVVMRPDSVVNDANGLPTQGVVPMTVGTTYAPQRAVRVFPTGSGNVEFQFPDGSTITESVTDSQPVTFPYACVSIVSGGTTAVATYYNMK